MLKEVNYQDIFRSKLNYMKDNKEHCTPLKDVRFVTKSFHEGNDVMTGGFIKDTYVSFNPDKKDRNNDIDKCYYSYLHDLWLKSGKNVNVEVSYADSLILNQLDALSELIHITAPGFLNKCYNIGHKPIAINKCYPNNNIESVVKELTKEWSHHKNFDLNKFCKLKVGLDLNICDDDAIINLANAKYQRFCNAGQDNNIKLVEVMPEKVITSGVDCGMLDSEGRPSFFTEANPSIMNIRDRLRLHAQKMDIFDMY